MRKALIIIMMLLSSWAIGTSAFAKTMIRLKIAGTSKENRYFLCIYGVGCLSMQAGSRGKTFYTAPTDMGNIKKLVILDGRNMRMYKNPSNGSCNIEVNDQQTLTISGSLATGGNGPHINGLRCAVAG